MTKEISKETLNLWRTYHARRKLKNRAVDLKGGKCSRCGYSKCITALHFHHLDPSEKDFNVGARIKSWNKIKEEVDKCILLCSNCHAEEHYNKEENDRRAALLKESKTNCIICNKESNNERFCSQACYGKNRVKWPENEEFQVLLNKMPITHLAEKLNVSSNSVIKRMKRLGLSKPPIGFFQKKENLINNTVDLDKAPSIYDLKSWELHKRRIDFRKKALKIKGSLCEKCGYDKYHGALHFHHLDPSEKSFTIASTSKSWTEIEEEIKKCILICSNCHAEAHYNQEEIDYQDKVLFANSRDNPESPGYAKNLAANNFSRERLCETCGKTINYTNKTCSLECAGKAAEKITWPSNEELQALINQMPMIHVAKKLGVSDNAVKKRMLKLGLIKQKKSNA